MLELSLFRIRNFWVANVTTLSAYAGLIGGLFFVGLFLQQVAGYTPVQAGLATTPIRRSSSSSRRAGASSRPAPVRGCR